VQIDRSGVAAIACTYRLLVLSVLTTLRAVLGRVLLAVVFGAIAMVLAQQVVGNMAERWGSAPQVTPAPVPPGSTS
jgi:hypothetical protein